MKKCADICTMCRYEKIMHLAVSLFAGWFCFISLSGLSVFSHSSSTVSGQSCGVSESSQAVLFDSDSAKHEDLVARLSQAMTSVKRVPLSKAATLPPSQMYSTPQMKSIDSSAAYDSSSRYGDDVFVRALSKEESPSFTVDTSPVTVHTSPVIVQAAPLCSKMSLSQKKTRVPV